jgi:hypothetical protein
MVHFVRNINDIEGKEVAPGVAERILIPPNETASKICTLKHLVIRQGCKYGPVQRGESESLVYCISGHGNLSHRGVSDYWTFYEFAGDKFSLIPPVRDFYILNCGEDSLRAIHVSYRLTEVSRTSVELLSKDNPPRVELFCKDKAPRIDMVPGFIARILLPPEVIEDKGIRRFLTLEHITGNPHNKNTFRPPSDTEIIAYFIRASGRAILGEDEYDLGAGTAVYTGPQHVTRVLDNTGDDVMIWLEIVGRA